MAASSDGWSYADNWRTLFAFLGASMVLIGIGDLAVATMGESVKDAATVLLALSVFFMIFALLLLFPRLRRRGVRSFGRVVDRPIEEIEAIVRDALEGAGRTVHVERMAARSRRPAAIVKIDGSRTHFVLEPFAGAPRSATAPARTEIVQIGISDESDDAARRLRDAIEARLFMEERGPA